MKLSKHLPVGIFLLFASTTFAQTTPAPAVDSMKRIELKEVIISGNRINIPLRLNPAAASVVTSAELQTMPRTIAVDEALRLVPGVRIDNQANGSRVHLSIRGQGILSERGLRGIKVLIDGIPVNDPTGFAADLYDVDWETVKQIEVLRGPAAALYGGGASAGILNILTNDGGSSPLNTRVSTSVGSNGFLKAGIQLGGSAANTNYKVAFSHLQGNGYREHTAFFGNNFSEKMKWSVSSRFKLTQLLTVSQYFNQNAEGLNIDQVNENPRQANPDAIPFNEYQYTTRITNGVTGQYQLNSNSDLSFNAYLRFGKYDEPGSSAVEHRTIVAPGFTLQYNSRQYLGEAVNHFSAGTDIQWQTIDGTKFANIKNPDRTESIGSFSRSVTEGATSLANQITLQSSLGLFAVDQLEFAESWSLVGSLRYDNIHNRLTDKLDTPLNHSGEMNFDNMTGKLGLAFAMNHAVNLYANWGQGFMPPATEELMSNPADFTGFNTNLKSATSSGEEFGVRGNIGRLLHYDVTGFNMNTHNDFYRYRILPSRPLETFYGNAGTSNRYGLETFVAFTPTENLNLKLAYTYSHFTYSTPDSLKNISLPNSPKHQLSTDLSYRFTKSLVLGLSTDIQSKWFIYTDKIHSNISQKGYALMGLRAGYQWKIGSVSGEINAFVRNLTNCRYIAFTEPDPDGNCYQPAANREFFAGVKLFF